MKNTMAYVGAICLAGSLLVAPFDSGAGCIMGILSGAAFAADRFLLPMIRPKRTFYIVDLKAGEMVSKKVWRK